MKYFMTSCLLLVACLFFLLPVHAQWTKYPQNPVIKAIPGSWYSLMNPSVIVENGAFKMWFSGYDGAGWKIGGAWSGDGVNWSVTSQPQISASSPGLTNAIEVVEPMVMKIGSVYQMWFKEYITGENRIRYATSTDGNTWTINPQPVFSKSNLSWEIFGPTNPSIIYDNNEYKMWYISAGSGLPWRMGYATSSDGVNWTRYQNNPLNIPTLGLVGGPTVIKINNQYHMWYHTGNGANTNMYHVISPDGINWVCDGNCSVLQIESNSFDSGGMIGPTALEQNGKLYVWYAGLNGGSWQIGLATLDPPITPTPTLSPTPTLTPTPTPTSYLQHPIILIPGFMASWNKEAILHNQTVSQSDWKLAPFVKEYDGIINTLKNIGYTENKNYFIFTYDWRKSLNDLANELSSYINQLITNNQSLTTFNIIGHSYGGLIGRMYAQKYADSRVQKLVTVGSPHQGTASSYKPVEAGELDKQDSLLWLAEKLLLQLYKDGIKTDKQIISEKFPAALDLFPRYNFLKNQNNEEIGIQNMQVQNTTLNAYNDSFNDLYGYLQTVSGEKSNTISGFVVGHRSVIDQLLDLYPDGRPTDINKQIGDGVIVSLSSKAGNAPIVFPYDHGEIIYKKEAVKSVLQSVGLNPSDNQLVAGSPTVVSPSLIFFMRSPARMEVAHNSDIFSEQDGIIFIPNVSSGSYTLRVTGIENGIYSVTIGQIGTDKDSWSTIRGTINNATPASQTDTYTIGFDQQLPNPPLTASESLSELILYLINLNNTLHNSYIADAVYDLQQSNSLYTPDHLQKLKSFFLMAHSYLLTAQNTLENSTDQYAIFIALEKLERLYQNSMTGYVPGTNTASVQNQLSVYQEDFSSVNSIILTKKNQGQDISKKLVLIADTDTHMKNAESYIRDQNFSGGEIVLKTNQNLIRLLKKL